MTNEYMRDAETGGFKKVPGQNGELFSEEKVVVPQTVEVVKHEVSVVANSNLPSTELRKDWGAAEEIDGSDITVPKIYHMQAISKLVQDGSALAGEWRDSLTEEMLAKRDEPLQLIIFFFNKKLLISRQIPGSSGDKPEYKWLRTENLTAENVNLPWLEDTHEGQIRRQKQYNYFVLLPGKLQELPYILSMMSTKIKTAMNLNTLFSKLSKMGLPSASYVFNFQSVKETKGETKTWYGISISQGRKTTPEELNVAYEWYQKIKTAAVNLVTDENDIEGDEDIPF